jgi:hypothetical protein
MQSPFYDHTDDQGEPRNSKGGLCLPHVGPAEVKNTPPLPDQPMIELFAEIPVNAHDKRTARIAQRPLL